MANFFDMFKQKTNHNKIIPMIFVIDVSGSMNRGRPMEPSVIMN